MSTSAVNIRAVPLHLLIADDNEMIRNAMGGVLRGLGHSVEAVSNGQEALEAAARQRYDAVFLDVQMPELGGLETACLLCRESPGAARPHVVICSGEGVDRESYAAEAMDDFLAKPIRLADLVRVLSRISHD